ncbi:hypothetical protein OSB04_002616 [Centaurea solstitialis]|uniref:Uncharacterized protein n=1 Tax=Centaurea solstitialis TaxID=347529 RepID=A0AA38U510_9ASTR|nr:hypothetical protein OSB04_002616 [Centaurea solstitialis]
MTLLDQSNNRLAVDRVKTIMFSSLMSLIGLPAYLKITRSPLESTREVTSRQTIELSKLPTTRQKTGKLEVGIYESDQKQQRLLLHQFQLALQTMDAD